jgi:hypothetical protein
LGATPSAFFVQERRDMNLSKAEALFLAKVLFHYEASNFNTSDVIERVRDLRGRLNSFLLGDECEGADDESEEDEEEDDFDQDEEPELEEDDDGEDEEDEEDEEGYSHVSSQILHSLVPVTVKDESGEKHRLEFEDVGGRVDAIIGDRGFVGAINVVLRTGTSIKVASDGQEWKTYTVSKFPPGWVSELAPGVTYRVDHIDKE